MNFSYMVGSLIILNTASYYAELFYCKYDDYPYINEVLESLKIYFKGIYIQGKDGNVELGSIVDDAFSLINLTDFILIENGRIKPLMINFIYVERGIKKLLKEVE